MNRSTVLLAATALAACAAASAAHAETVTQMEFSNATGFCQAALPAYEGNIRKRPTAVANEGSGSAFVSCSMPSTPESVNGVESISLVIYNRTAAPTDITCSLVHAFQSGGTVVPRTVSVPASSRAFFEWTAAELSASQVSFGNFSCALKPGTDVGYAFYFYDYEIGT